MDEGWKQALRDNHEELRVGLLVEMILFQFRHYLTDVEYFRIHNQPVNMAQVDELVEILLMKGKSHFDGFCNILEHNGYQHWAHRLLAAASGHREADGKCTDSLI